MFLLEMLCKYTFPNGIPTVLGTDMTGVYSVVGLISAILYYYFMAVYIHTIFTKGKST